MERIMDASSNSNIPIFPQKEDRNSKLVYTKTEAAQMLGVKETSINWLLRKGLLPHRKVAGKIRFAEIDLLTYLDRVKVDAAVIPCCVADTKGGLT
jgi:excisionase family DNA binding protein